MQNFLVFAVAVQSLQRFKVFKLNVIDVLPVQALSIVKKSNREFNSFPVTPVSWS